MYNKKDITTKTLKMDAHSMWQFKKYDLSQVCLLANCLVAQTM